MNPQGMRIVGSLQSVKTKTVERLESKKLMISTVRSVGSSFVRECVDPGAKMSDGVGPAVAQLLMLAAPNPIIIISKRTATNRYTIIINC